MYIIFKQQNGHLGVINPFVDVNDAVKDVPEVAEYQIVNVLKIEKKYFDAYDYDAETGAKINIERAKAVHLNRFREARLPRLQKLDIEYMKALEAGDITKSSEIAAVKQALRYVTLTPLPDDFEGIKATWPEIIR